MDLYSSKQMLALLQRQPDHSQRVFGHVRATADLMNANDPSGPTNSNMTCHFIPAPGYTTRAVP
jgi:hypothetical protein